MILLSFKIQYYKDILIYN